MLFSNGESNEKKNKPGNNSKKGNVSSATVKVVQKWAKRRNTSSVSTRNSPIENKRSEVEMKKPERLKSFNAYLTTDDNIQSVNEYMDTVPDSIEGTYKHDYNINDIHNLILKKFQRQRDYEITKLEDKLQREEIKINGKQNMVERKASLKVINEIKKEMEDILTNRKCNEYMNKIRPLIDGYNLLGSLSKIVSFTKRNKSRETDSLSKSSESDDDLPEDIEKQSSRQQLILDFIEIARKYIQIDLIREIKETRNCPACGTKFEDDNTDDEGISLCPNCGIEKISVVKTKFYQDNIRTNNSGNNYEDRENFRKVIARYQGKEPNKPPPDLYQKLEEYFIENEVPKIDINGSRKFVTPEYIRNNVELNGEGEKIGTSRSLMNKALKDTKNTDYYNHLNTILHEFWGWKLPDIAHLEEQIMEDYDTSQRIYEILPKDRKSSLNSQFRLYKHLRRLGYSCKAKDFSIPSTHDILEFHNNTWSKICEILNWENI